jgi:hypothetical protein
MPLLSFWSTNADAVGQLSIEQIVASAGDGNLKDQSTCSAELREYLGQIPTSKISLYVDHCLSSVFPKNGMVLQDLVNELGRRLEYLVTNGRYQGVTNAIGFDGLWRSPEGHCLVVEVKTTDVFRLSLDTLALYRAKLEAGGSITPQSSILIVVGRHDTGELEAQIRGSRHAWDVRLISAEALIKLVQLKENSEAAETGLKIRSLLIPVEYTRLDRMVDVMFTTATDMEDSQPLEELPADTEKAGAFSPVELASNPIESKNGYQFTNSGLLQAKREAIVTSLGKRERVPLVRKTRALYWSAGHDVRVACSISKRYLGKNQNPYWYAYHPAWKEFLDEAERSFFVLGCMDRDEAYALPREQIAQLLPFMHTTSPKDGTMYWHIHITERQGALELLVPKNGTTLPLAPFALASA